MAEAKRFKVLLKDKREETITAEGYDNNRMGFTVFHVEGKEVARFQVGEVVAIIEQ